jgi:hypothetical protein
MVFFLLPPGAVLNDNPAPGAAEGVPGGEIKRHGASGREEADLVHGLGGYHGSIQAGGQDAKGEKRVELDEQNPAEYLEWLSVQLGERGYRPAPISISVISEDPT